MERNEVCSFQILPEGKHALQEANCRNFLNGIALEKKRYSLQKDVTASLILY